MTGYNSSLLYISGQLGVQQPHRGSAQALGGLRRLQHQRVSLRGRGTQGFLTITIVWAAAPSGTRTRRCLAASWAQLLACPSSTRTHLFLEIHVLVSTIGK